MKNRHFMERLSQRRESSPDGETAEAAVMAAPSSDLSIAVLDRAGVLMPDQDAVVLPLHQVCCDPDQGRKTFEDIEALALNILANGQQHAVVVKVIGEGRYQLVDGERRYRAIQHLQQQDPVRFGTLRAWINRDEALRDVVAQKIVQLATNEQRAAVPPLELAREYHFIMQAKGWSQQELATQIHKSKSTVSKTLKLLDLDAADQARLESGALSVREVKESRRGAVQKDAAREARVALPMSAARTLAQLLKALAAQQGLVEIVLPEKASKKALLAILEARSSEVLAAVKGD